MGGECAIAPDRSDLAGGAMELDPAGDRGVPHLLQPVGDRGLILGLELA